MAPKIGTFADFVNKIIARIGVNNHTFSVTALMHQATRGEILNMPFIGRSTIQISATNNIFDDLINMMGGTAQEFIDVECFEISIKPKNRKNIKTPATRLINSTPDAGLERLVVKAKDEAQEALVDLYLAGKGLISDQIDLKKEANLAERIREKIAANEMLGIKIEEYEQNGAITQNIVNDIANFNNVGTWAVTFDHLQNAA